MQHTLPPVNKSQLTTLVVSALACVGVGVGVVLMVDSAPTTLVGTCPLVSPTRFAVIVERLRNTANDYTRHDGTLVVFDMATGTRVGAVEVGSWMDDAQRPVCFGAAGEGSVWFRPAGASDSFEVRAIASGAVTTPFRAFVQQNPSLGVGISAMSWDETLGVPTVSTADGRLLQVDAASRNATRYDGQVLRLGGEANNPIHSRDVDYYVGGMPGLRMADGRRVALDGHPRSRMKVDGVSLFGERDFLSPDVLLAPGTDHIEWTSPPSLVVVEETLVNSLRYRVTRIGLDGNVLFSFDPGEALPASLRYRPSPWASSPDGSVLLHFGAEGVIAIDAVTGAERYRMGYDGEAMARPE